MPNPLSLGIFGQLAAVRDRQDARAQTAAQEAAALRTRSLDDALKQASAEHLKAQSYAALHPQPGLHYVQDAEGNWVGLPTKAGVEAGPSGPNSDSWLNPAKEAAALKPFQSGAKPPASRTLEAAIGGDQGSDQGPQGPPTIEQRVSALPSPQRSVTVRQTGVRGAPKPVAHIDPNSAAGITADSIKAVNRAAIKPPEHIDPNSTAGISADSAKEAKRQQIKVANPLPKTENAQQQLTGARAEAAVSEMNNAHPSMVEYEKKLANHTADISGLQQFLGSLGDTFTKDDAHSIAMQSAAIDALNTTNPDLARYIRRGMSWAEGESMISQRPSDYRTKLAAFLSTAATHASPEMIGDIQSRRSALLGPLNKRFPGYGPPAHVTGDAQLDAILARHPAKPPA